MSVIERFSHPRPDEQFSVSVDDVGLRPVTSERNSLTTWHQASGGALGILGRRANVGANHYSGPANVFLCRSDVRTAKIAASVQCFIPIFNKRFET